MTRSMTPTLTPTLTPSNIDANEARTSSLRRLHSVDDTSDGRASATAALTLHNGLPYSSAKAGNTQPTWRGTEVKMVQTYIG